MFTRTYEQFEHLTLAVLLTLGLSASAVAQQATSSSSTTTPAAQAPGAINRAELDNLDRFLDNHPNIRHDLQQNPSLINDPTFQAQNPQLQTFLKNHPGVAQQVQANPAQLMARERRFETSGADITRAEAANADRFLDSHPKIAEELRQNPKLIDNKEWVSQHPQLEQYLKSHPEIRKDWQEHPKIFERRQAQYQHYENTKKHQGQPMTAHNHK